MNENKSQAILEKMLNAIRIMRKYKSDNRLCGGVRLFIGEDVLADLLAGGRFVSDSNGKYSLDGYRVLIVKGYPMGYIAAE